MSLVKNFISIPFAFVIILNCQLDAAPKTLRRCFLVAHECPNNNITFHLYTRRTQNHPTQLDLNNTKTILTAKFAKNRPLVVLIHGYTGNKDFSPNRQIRPAYFKRNEYNIISVDYKSLVMEPCYPISIQNLPTVANCTAQLLDFLVDKNIFTLDSIHVVSEEFW